MVDTVSAPTVAQSGAPVQINAPPAAFGATALGEGAKAIGGAAQQASDVLSQHALAFQQIANQNEADQASLAWSGKAAQDVEQFKMNNRGMAASTNMTGFIADQEAQRKEAASTLSNPVAQQLFNQDSRRMAMYTARDLSTFATTEFVGATKHTANSMIENAQGQAAAAVTAGRGVDDEAVQANIATIAQQVHTLAKLDGYDNDPASVHGALVAAVSPIFTSAIVQHIGAQDIPGAQKIFADHADSMTLKDINQVVGALKAGVAANAVQDPIHQIYDLHQAPQGSAVAGNSDPRAFFNNFIAPHEGSRTVTDSNGAPVQYGINKADHPEADVGHLTQAQAAEIYATKYARSDLPPALSAAYGDTAFMSGRGEADKLLAASGGDVGKFITLREQFQQDLANSNPEKYGRYAQVWQQRSEALRSYISDMATTGSTPGAPPAFNEPPPTFAANADPAAIRDGLLSYNQRYAATIPDATTRSRFLSAADARANLQANIANDGQKAAFDQANNYIVGGLPNGQAVHSYEDLPPSLTSALSPSYQTELRKAINYSQQGIGAYKTLEMTANAESLMGLSGSNRQEFINTDLTKITLSAPDFMRLSSLKSSLQRNDAAKAAQAEKYNTLLAVPQVKAIIASQFEQTPITPTQPQGVEKDYDLKPTAGGNYVPSQAHLAFLGSLMGEVERAQAANGGKPLTQDEIGTIANSLILSKGPHGLPLYRDIPPEAKAGIVAGLTRLNGYVPTPQEVSEYYHRNR